MKDFMTRNNLEKFHYAVKLYNALHRGTKVRWTWTHSMKAVMLIELKGLLGTVLDSVECPMSEAIGRIEGWEKAHRRMSWR